MQSIILAFMWCLFDFMSLCFYYCFLGHELVHSHPKHAISWYTVGCYYWTCHKLELAQKYLQKATKIDKRCECCKHSLPLMMTIFYH